MGMVQPVLNKNEKFHEYFNPSHNCFLIRSKFNQILKLSKHRTICFFFSLFIFEILSQRFSKHLIFDVSNVSFLIFLLFTIFSFNITLIFFFFDSSSFSFSRSLFTFYTYSIVSLSRLLVTKRRRSSWKSALFRRTLTTGNPGNLIHRETKSMISIAECVLFARISKNSRESALRNW